MNHFLQGMSKKLGPKKLAVVITSGAGWHQSDDLIVPENIILYHLPPYSPELNPIEQI